MALPPEQRFHFRDGTDVEDLEGLKQKIERISYDEFYNHVNEEKNDFANWIGDVLQQRELAEKLRKVSSIVETVELLNEALYPEKVEQDEQQLEQESVPDFQKRIEEELFAPSAEPTKEPEFGGEIPDITAEPAPTMAEVNAEASESEAGGEEVSLPPPEEVEGTKLPGAPVTTTKPAHVPVTERLDRPVTKEEHLRFLTKESLFGFLLGIITGFILGVIVALYA